MIICLVAVAVVSLAELPSHITQDTWLALVSGRYIVHHGIPQHDTLFVITHGARWIDQQWLAQLVLYGLHQVGGLALNGLVFIALTMAGFAMTIAAARRFGGSERHILWVMPVAGFLYFAGSSNVRTQGFAYPLFAATLWLLVRESRHPRDRRIFWVFPLLVLWGNLHGSVTVGVALAIICGLVLLVGDVRGRGWREGLGNIRARSALLIVLSPLCLLVNPYGLASIQYYRETLLNPAFTKAIAEWQPVTSSMVLAIPVFAAATVTVWLMGRLGRRMPAFDQLALLFLAACAVLAVRNVAWYGLGLMALVPGTLTCLLPNSSPSVRRARLNLSLAAVSLAVLAITFVAVATKPESWFASRFDTRALSAVNRLEAAHPGTHIWADNRYADWLLWREPQLAGQIGYDIRFELLSPNSLDKLTGATLIPAPHQPNVLDGYGALVLDRTSSSTPRLLARSGTHVVLRGHGVAVATWQP